MKRWKQRIKYGLFLWLFPFCLHGVEERIAAGGGIFRPDSSFLRKIYGSVWLDSRIEIVIPVWKQLCLFSGCDYLRKSGHSLGGKERTKIILIPISLGLERTFELASWLDFYPLLGARYYLGWFHNHSNFVRRKIFRQTVGVTAAVGFLFTLYHHLILDLNVGYS